MRLKLSLLDVCAILMVLGLLAGLLMPGSDFDLTHRYPPTAAHPENNLADLAGEYRQGARLGRSISLSILPDGRYSFIWSGCTRVHHGESGYVHSDGAHYVLSPLGKVRERLDRTLLLVRWQRRRYLVPPQKMLQFCDAVVEGEEPRNELPGDFYLGVPFDRADGVPELPETWANYLRENVTVGRIMVVKDGGQARINLGRAEGIREDTILTVQGSPRYRHRYLRVVSVDEESCLADECSPGRSDQPLEAGWGVVAPRRSRESEDP
jgi:hypothetical protein